MYEDQWGQLPEWCRPGTKTWIFSYKGAVRVTIKNVTRTQIRAVERVRSDYEHVHTLVREVAEDRQAREHGDDGQPKFHERGSFSSYLVHPNFRPAILEAARAKADRVMRSAFNVDIVRKQWVDLRREKDATPELAMELLDKLENQVREARREVEQWTKIMYSEGP